MISAKALAACLILASATYDLPLDILSGIQLVEGGAVGKETGPNRNGSYDLGPMQINSAWVPRLAALWHVDARTARDWLRDDPCVNTHVAAWILKKNAVDAGSLYEGIALYHTGTSNRADDYVQKVLSASKKTTVKN